MTGVFNHPLTADEKNTLSGSFEGELIFRDDEGYEEARINRIFNKRIPQRYPEAILLAKSERDLIKAVLLAKDQGWQIAVRGGGHSYEVSSVRDQVLLIDPSQYKEIKYNEATGIVTATPTVTMGNELNPFLAQKGRYFCGGHNPTVGLGGYLLSGGQGWVSRGWGWSAEHIEAIDVITANGELVRADEQQNSDLFWAARGAGPGFFGLIVRYHLRTVPLPSVLVKSSYSYPIEEFEHVMKWLMSIHHKVSPNVELLATSRADSSGENHSPILTVTAIAFVQNLDEAKKALAPISTCPVKEKAIKAVEVQPTSFDELLAEQLISSPENHCHIVDSAWLDGKMEDLIAAMKPAFANLATPKSYTLWYSMAPLRDLPDMALSMQTENFVAAYVIYDKDEEERDESELRQFLTEQMKKMEPATVGQYIGNSDFTSRGVKFMADKNWQRLQEIRKQRDPDELFVGYLTNSKENLNKNEWEVIHSSNR